MGVLLNGGEAKGKLSPTVWTLAVSARLKFFGPCNIFARLVDLIGDIPLQHWKLPLNEGTSHM
jgi:hypothetical protein